MEISNDRKQISGCPERDGLQRGTKELQGVAGVSSVITEIMVTLAKTQTANVRLVNLIVCKLYFIIKLFKSITVYTANPVINNK